MFEFVKHEPYVRIIILSRVSFFEVSDYRFTRLSDFMSIGKLNSALTSFSVTILSRHIPCYILIILNRTCVTWGRTHCPKWA